MARCLNFKAESRGGNVAAAIRDALAQSDTATALTLAVAALRSETAKVRRQRPADGALTDAMLAGQVAAIAANLHSYRPPKPRGLKTPSAQRLLDVFESALNPPPAGGDQ